MIFSLIWTLEMTFLNPIFLWASFVIAIPIIVHLFNFRRPKRIAFSDVSLVKEVRRSVVRRLRLRQWLLLAARCLALLALVLVFADPVWREEGAVQRVGSSSVAVVVDNSYSMKGGNDKGSYWLQAQKIGMEVLKAYGRNDEFLVMSTSQPKVHFSFGDQSSAVEELRRLEMEQNMRSLPDLLAQVSDFFSHSANQNRDLYVISDFQRSTVFPDSAFSFEAPSGMRVHLVSLTTRPLQNAFVDDHEVVSQIVEQDVPVALSLDLVNDAAQAMKNVGLRVVVGNEVRPLATEDLEPGQEVTLDFNVTPRSSGWQAGYIELDDHPVDFDNRRYFSFYVPEREKMLVVEGQRVRNLRIMLGSEVLSQFDTRFVSYRDFAATNLDDFKSVVLVGLDELSSGMQDKLVVHLKAGRSILNFVSPGSPQPHRLQPSSQHPAPASSPSYNSPHPNPHPAEPAEIDS